MKAKPNPALVPLNVAFIDKVAGQLAGQLLQSGSLIAEQTIQVRRADGKRHKVWINVLTRSWLKGRLPGTLFGKLAQHHDPEDDPEAWDKTKTVTIQLDADLIRRYLETDPAKTKTLLQRDLRLILLHELTHSAEPKLTNAKYSKEETTLKSYYRDPQEVRARTREVVDSILHGNPKARVRDYREARAGGYRGTLVEFLADTTEQWRHMHPFLEPAAEKRALQMIERALRDKKIDTSGKGSLPNPRPIPLDSDQVDALVEDLFRQIKDVGRKMAEAEKYGEPFAQSTIDLVKPDGTTMPVTVVMPRQDGSNLGYREYIAHADFSRKRSLITLKVYYNQIRTKFGQEATASDRTEKRFKKELRDVLVHELTHAAEPRAKAPTYAPTVTHQGKWTHIGPPSMEAHENDPQEIRANAQMIVQQILQSSNLSGYIRKYRKLDRSERPANLLDWLLKKSTKWKQSQEFMTPETQRKVMMMVERGLRDADIDTSGKGEIPNPARKVRDPSDIENRIERWLRYENDFINWSPPNTQSSEATTLKIAQSIGVDPKKALAACQRLAKRGVIEKRGRVPYRDRGERHDHTVVGWELWGMTWTENPAAKTKAGHTVKIARSDGSTEEVPAIEQFGDLAVVERLQKRKHRGYNVVHAPTGKLFRQLRTKPEAVAQARFYGSVPEGMALLRRIVDQDPTAGPEITAGTAFAAWQQGRARTKPVEYKAHYWFRVKKQDPNQPRGSTIE